MSGYTRISCMLWDWPRWTQLEPTTRLLWLALYTSSQAKRWVPGLWYGSIISMAEAARLPFDETARCLGALIDLDLVEFDKEHSVLRLTVLPDAGEWPSNPSILESWWKRFRQVPPCGVRDAHVLTLRWMLDRGASEAEKNASGKPSLKHEDIWCRTFGTVPIPAPRRRGVRRILNSDTGTDVQPGLFQDREDLPDDPSDSSSLPSSPTLVRASGPARYPQDDVGSVENPKTNKITVRETLSRGSGEGEGEGEGDLRSGGGVEGVIHSPPSNVVKLTLVAGATAPFTADELHSVMVAAPSWPPALTEAQRLALDGAIRRAGLIGLGEALLALLAERIEKTTALAGISPEVLAQPGYLTLVVQEAAAWRRESVASSTALREAQGNVTSEAKRLYDRTNQRPR